jgi:hypothetical protein
MSRSTRKPYAACTGTRSAKDDKRRANRGVRHKQNQWLRTLEDYDSALAPHRMECSWNNVWSWGRDGHQYLQEPGKWERQQYAIWVSGFFKGEWEREYLAENYSTWPPKRYLRLKRK